MASHYIRAEKHLDEDDDPQLEKELCDLACPADILIPVGDREPQIGAQAVLDLVAIQHSGLKSKMMQVFLGGMGDRGFSGCWQAGQPDDRSPVPVLFLALLQCNGMRMPLHVPSGCRFGIFAIGSQVGDYFFSG